MSSIDIIGMAVKNLIKRKLRTFLTTVSVILGVALITVMMSLSMGLKRSMTQMLTSMGDLLTVNVYKPYGGDAVYSSGGTAVYISGSGSSQSSGELLLDDKAIEGFKAMPGVVTATAFVDISLKSVSGKLQNWVQVRGIDPEAMELLGYKLKEGTGFTGENKNEVIFGYNPPFDYYNPRDRNRVWSYWWPGSGEEDTRTPPVNIFEDKIQFSYDWNFGETGVFNQISNQKPVKPYTMKVVGWLEYNGNTDYYVLMNKDEVLKIKAEQEKWQNSQYQQRGGSGNKNRAPNGYDNVIVKFGDIKSVEQGLNDIRAMGYQAYGMVESLQQLQEFIGYIQIFLGVIGGVVLFISAIFIANTMYMAINERTKEIGIMKVIGATLSDIRRLFLLEAGMLGLLGGVIGIAISLIASAVINKFGGGFMQQLGYGMSSGGISYIPAWLCLMAAGGAMVMGMLAGFLPARRAMKLSALAAIRVD